MLVITIIALVISHLSSCTAGPPAALVTLSLHAPHTLHLLRLSSLSVPVTLPITVLVIPINVIVISIIVLIIPHLSSHAISLPAVLVTQSPHALLLTLQLLRLSPPLWCLPPYHLRTLPAVLATPVIARIV